jgi:two-component system chemotaxis response regulator CheY
MSHFLSRHCLVVDDSKMIRKVMTRMLKLLGYTTEEAGDGVECFRMIEGVTKRFELVLIDNNMPIMCGPEAVLRLRQVGFRGIVVGVTGDASQGDIEKFLEAGVDEVLIKPVTYECLQLCLTKFGLINAYETKYEENESESCDVL